MLVVFCLVVRITGLICIYRQNHEDVARLNNIHNIKREKVVAMDVTWVVLCVRWWCTFNGKLCSVYRTSNYPEGRDGTKLHKSISQAAAYHQRLLHQNHDTFIVISSINILRSQTVPIHWLSVKFWHCNAISSQDWHFFCCKIVIII